MASNSQLGRLSTKVADKIRRDERVSVVERTNLRYLPGLPRKVDLVTLDRSFISILLVMPAVVNVMKERSYIGCSD
ncbi:uncharacterized protein LOC114277518 [Camellia sinensis]|uniref:uncharacterized protein LOC114277518 n=1 Tax=Camellia sinensis TaxID=4442 RepID=UPI001036E06E|nr:uncharacterized protein LOC114277518 [Camellia sinensis]